MRGVKRWISLPGHRRFFEAAVIPCVMVFAVGCHGGVDTPVGPTVTSTLQTTSNAAIVADADTVTAHGGPLSFTLDAVGDSGYSGTCTVGTGGAGFRLKAAGNGMPDSLIRFRLGEETASGGYDYPFTQHVEVDQRGNFRTQERVTYLASGRSVKCLLMGPDNATVLAEGPAFDIP
jgi:hypothetical protein